MPPMSVLILEYIDAFISTNEISNSKENISIYPNPANNILCFSKVMKEVEVINVYGQKVLSQKMPATFISTEGLAPGCYFLKSDEAVLKFIVK